MRLKQSFEGGFPATHLPHYKATPQHPQFLFVTLLYLLFRDPVGMWASDPEMLLHFSRHAHQPRSKPYGSGALCISMAIKLCGTVVNHIKKIINTFKR